jgi:hypothetical protein
MIQDMLTRYRTGYKCKTPAKGGQGLGLLNETMA